MKRSRINPERAFRDFLWKIDASVGALWCSETALERWLPDHASHIASIAEGGPVVPFTDIASQTRDAATLCRDLNEAREQRHQQSRAVRQKALGELCKTLLPEQFATLKRMGAAFVEAHAANRDYQDLKDYLIGQGGLVGICLTHPEKILGHHRDRNSDLALLLREFVSTGVLDAMPAGLK